MFSWNDLKTFRNRFLQSMFMFMWVLLAQQEALIEIHRKCRVSLSQTGAGETTISAAFISCLNTAPPFSVQQILPSCDGWGSKIPPPTTNQTYFTYIKTYFCKVWIALFKPVLWCMYIYIYIYIYTIYIHFSSCFSNSFVSFCHCVNKYIYSFYSVISVVVLVILVHQVKLNENKKWQLAEKVGLYICKMFS